MPHPLLEEIHAERRVTGNDSLNVIAVSKTVPSARIEMLLQDGHRHFGENRVQEAHTKWPRLKSLYPDAKLHMVGTLQRNKLAQMLRIADYFHGLDRVILLEDLARRRDQGSSIPKLFIQVNLTQEPQKSGCKEQDVPILLAQARAYDLPIVGLMTITALDRPARPTFEACAALARKHALKELSMGMSDDWQDAVACGATWIRLGHALFGERGQDKT